MLIFRIENPVTRRGLYSGASDDISAIFPNFYATQHPTPEDDGIKKVPHENYKFGFADKRQLVKWVDNKARKRIRENKFDLVLSAYRVPKKKIRFGGHQIIFDSSHATLMWEKRL